MVFAPRISDWIAVFLIGLAGMAGAVGGIIFPKFSGALLDHYKLTASGESAGYVILFTICSSAYIVAFAINHLFAPRFEAIRLQER